MKLIKSLGALLVMTFSLPAAAAPVIGGITAVSVTANLAALGLTIGTVGTATSSTTGVPRVFFPITGGDLNPANLGGTILHNGSGVTFTAGANVLTTRNFVIDTINQRITGDVLLNGSSLASSASLFTFNLAGLSAAQITNTANPALALNISPTAAGVFTQVFNAPNLSGAQFGLAATAPQLAAVPEPASWAMLIAGFGLVGASLRTRRTAKPAFA
jgi:hypothetical protein